MGSQCDQYADSELPPTNINFLVKVDIQITADSRSGAGLFVPFGLVGHSLGYFQNIQHAGAEGSPYKDDNIPVQLILREVGV